MTAVWRRCGIASLLVLCVASLGPAEPPTALPPPESESGWTGVGTPPPPVMHSSAPWPAPEKGPDLLVDGDSSLPAPPGHGLPPLVVDAEYFLLAPRRNGQDFAIVGTNPFWGPQGVIKSVDGNYDSGFRLGAGYRVPGEGVDLRLLYTYLHSASDQTVGAPPGGSVFPTLTHPSTVLRVDAATANSSVNLNLFDLEVGRRLDLAEGVWARVFAGPRFANLDQKLRVAYAGGDVARDDVRQRLFFDGGGVRVGADTNWRLLEYLGLYLRGSASLLTGRFRGDLGEVANGSVIVNVTEHYTRVVPIADLGVGLSFQRGGLRLSVGYEFINWFGVVNGIDFADDAQPAKLNRRTGDLGLDGVVFRAEWLF